MDATGKTLKQLNELGLLKLRKIDHRVSHKPICENAGRNVINVFEQTKNFCPPWYSHNG